MSLAFFKSPGNKAAAGALCAALLACSAMLAWDVIHKRAKKVFFQSDLEWYGDAFWKGKKGVDVSSPSDSLPVQLPGPEDGWAGGESKEIRLAAPFDFKTEFTIRFLESHETAPPLIEAWMGGVKVAAIQVEKGTGYPRIHWPRDGRTSKASFVADSRYLRPGAVITLRSVSGSWAAIQGISAAGKPEKWEIAAAAASGAASAAIVLLWAVSAAVQSGAGARGVLFASVLALMGAGVGLSVGEMLFRLLDVLPRPMKPLPTRGFVLSQNPVMLFENRPNLRVGAKGEDGWVAEYSTNSAGFRDVERSLAKPAGVYRIIVLGDSTTAGAGVGSEEALFTRQLEARLNGGVASKRFEVLNMGVFGYHTLQEAELLRVKGLPYQPDMAIVLFCHNDFQLNVDGGTYYNLLMSNPDFKFQGRSSGLADLVIARSRLAFVVYHRVMAAVNPPSHYDEIVNDYKEKYLGSRSTVEAAMENLSAMAGEGGFLPVVAILPLFDRPFTQYRHGYQHDRVKEIGSGFKDIEVWDLLEGFSRIDDQAGTFAWDGMHLNERGHQAAAAILFEKIKAKLEEKTGEEAKALSR